MPTNFNNTSLTNATTPNLSTSSFMTLDGLNPTRTSAVYQISVSPAQANISVKAAIRGLTTDIDLALVRDLNNNGIAENNEILRSSKLNDI